MRTSRVALASAVGVIALGIDDLAAELRNQKGEES